VARITVPTHAELSPTERAFMEGFAALRSGDAHAATLAFERAATDSGGIAEDASFWRAVALRRDGRSGDALRAFAGFLDRFPGSPRKGEAAVALGWLELQQGQTDVAAAHFRLAVDDPAHRVRASAADGLRTATFSH
jgi:TolA-binding protein